MKTTKPPKDRDFLALTTYGGGYWDRYFWGTKADGLDKGTYVDSQLFAMPDIVGWVEIPAIPEDIATMSLVRC